MSTNPPYEGEPSGEMDTSASASSRNTSEFGAPNAPTVPDAPAPPSLPPAFGSSDMPGTRGPYGGYGVAEAASSTANPVWPGTYPFTGSYSASEKSIDDGTVVPDRMPPKQASTLARRVKRWVIGSSVAAFLVLAGLAAGNVVGVTAQSSAANSGASQSPAVNNSGEHNDHGENDNPFFGGQSGSSNFGPAVNQPAFGGSSHS